MSDVREIVRDLVREFETQEKEYRSMHQHEAADRLGRQASVLHSYLDESGSPTHR